MKCDNLGRLIQSIKDPATGKTTEFFECKTELRVCSPTVDGFKDASGKEISLCSVECPLRKAIEAKPVAAASASPPLVTPVIYLEPVGDKLSEILIECGIKRPTCGECARWKKMMNEWGISGCQENRDKILERLNKEAASGTWLEKIGAAMKGYTSTAALLNEAIKRCRPAV